MATSDINLAARFATHSLRPLNRSHKMLSLSTLALGNTAEISTGDVRKNQAFDNIKASVAQALRIGNLNTNLEGSYDYKANKDFFNEVTATGSILSPSKDKKGNVVDDVSLDYEITHSLTGASTNVAPALIRSSLIAMNEVHCLS